ncbi:MAG: anaerobic ribonucleoside-triphosphate reductase activating protein [Methanocalculus sp. MSAO_Arc1]|uniref:anaerobic ribonucleoside-triphosphate reductase activating protein n=1 Tax=Methanocalculus TaxID=71151 RepID=UPI000FF1E68A|nr:MULTISPECIES: anaerobic ribonucleoside-triphosphate reductase activating protein [unclassified Methanocalculus]MCP1661819.1 pyruvate formate lyase activating enzyme [Methanocalculus sp. AMF5]RQD80209.1 MAG: anaerobic ribonucleoside-triphosphate reductase activating protein [Methanocalculus sp. MSAO_Arc1]
MLVNFGGFIPISTVDWPGRAVCTVFLRGCPVRCDYCHNADLQNGSDLRLVDEILAMIQSSCIAASGVIFSGGEPTHQGEALRELAKRSSEMGIRVGIHTNGVYPETLRDLISDGSLHRVALDIKARWNRYDNLLRENYCRAVKETLITCQTAYLKGELPEFQVVITLFRGYEDEVKYISRDTMHLPLVLQQGVFGEITPLSSAELRVIADGLGRSVIIRTREDGEFYYEGTRTGRSPGER